MAKRIVLTGGGTGGHLYPLVAVADYIRQSASASEPVEFLFMGPGGKIEKDIMQSYSIPMKYITCGKLRRYFSPLNFLDFFKIPIGLVQAAWHLFRYMPDAVYAKGGYASVPVVVMAKIYRIPILIHESDALPGLANKFLGSLADKIAINFKKAGMFFPPSRTFVSGMPIKKEAVGGDAQKAREFLKMPYMQKPVIMFLGGSQGAANINQEIVNNIKTLIESYQIIHQTGTKHYETICQLMQEKGIDTKTGDYRPLAYIGNELKDLFALADIVVSRAGATFIAEIAANSKPSILIPIAGSANGHQRVNAYELAKAGATIVLEEDNFRRGMLLHNLHTIMTDDTLRQNLGDQIAEFYNPAAASMLATELMNLAKVKTGLEQ